MSHLSNIGESSRHSNQYHINIYIHHTRSMSTIIDQLKQALDQFNRVCFEFSIENSTLLFLFYLGSKVSVHQFNDEYKRKSIECKRFLPLNAHDRMNYFRMFG